MMLPLKYLNMDARYVATTGIGNIYINIYVNIKWLQHVDLDKYQTGDLEQYV